jgi:hypothetical protein
MLLQAQLITVALTLSIGLTACARNPAPLQGRINSCAVSGECVIEGRIYVHRGVPSSGAEIKTENGCFALALSESDSTIYSKSPGLEVKVRGQPFEQYYDDRLISYRIKDRSVAAGICIGSPVIYVTNIAVISASLKPRKRSH